MEQISQYVIFSFISAAAYFYFNWRYFAWVTAAVSLPRMAAGPIVGAFFLNYLVFFVCSRLEFNLIVNWAVFFLFLFWETSLYNRGHRRDALFFSLGGIICGLAINIFCRCAVSIVTALPLADFDNHVSSAGNLKGIPVFLGFLLGGIILHLMALPRYLKMARTLLAHSRHLKFLLVVLGGMFLYLFLNLLIYQSRENGVLLKLWGIKSCVFSVVGSCLGLRYSLRMCDLTDYREKNRAIRLALARKEREEEGLRSAAYQDPLTGAYNRQYAVETIERLLGQSSSFVICFADLDHLKEVNDRYGHTAGDRYLKLAARELAQTLRKEDDLFCRYGGDEFLLLFRETSVETVEKRLRLVDGRLHEAKDGEGAYPFPMSLSFGTVDCRAGRNAEELVGAADAIMYERKRAKSAERV